MGEAVEVVEGSDSEISRLFPKCRPRFILPSTAFVSEINNSHIIQGTAVTSTTADVNKNCVSDANDNYQVFSATLEDVTLHRDDSSGCDSSRMSVDSACATTSSTPASHSSSSSSSHTSFATHNYPGDEKSGDLNGGGTLNANDDLSVVSAYNDDRFSSTVLDSSFEDTNVGGRVMGSPQTINSSHKRSIVHGVSHNMSIMQNDSHITPSQQQPQQQQQKQHQQPLSLFKREHFRLRDSRIETAGGKEMFSQSRSRPSRKRHEEGRRGIHHASHHFNHNSNNSSSNSNHQPLIHNSHHHHQHVLQQQKHQPSQKHASQQPNEYGRKTERSTSRSNSTNSNSSSSSNERSSESKSDCKDPPDEESEVSPSRVACEDVSDNVSSTLVYETRLSGSSEVVFDDISEWVERGLSVRGVETSSMRRARRGSNNESQQQFVNTSITPPTPLSRSERDSEYDDDDDEDDDDEEDEDDDSSMRVTRIGSVPIAEYEGSPRRYGQPIRPPRPGFPRRVNNISQDERTRVLINSMEGDKKSAEALSRNEKSHSSYRHEFRKSKHRSNVYQRDKVENDPTKSTNSAHERSNIHNPSGGKETQTNLDKRDPEKDETHGNLEFSQDNNSPVKISISTITSSYASSLPNKTVSSTEKSSDKNNSSVFEDYRFEDSETRKVLDEFFLESKGKPQEFYDLEYTLKRQHGNSYVGQRLATTECEEGADQPQPEESYVPKESAGNPTEMSEKLPNEESFSEVSTRQDNASVDKKNITGNTSENSPNVVQENGNGQQDNCEIGISRNFTLSPETTSCDSLDVESEFSVGDAEGSIPSSGKIVNTMPVLEDGLSSGDESEIEINTDQRLFSSEEHQAVLIRQQMFIDQHMQMYQSGPLHVYSENKNGEFEDCGLERERAYQRTRSLDNQLCRGELPPLASSMPPTLNHHGTYPTSLPVSSLSPLSPNAPSSPFSGNSAPHATSSPHAKHTQGKTSNAIVPPPAPPPPPHSTHSTLTTHSPSSSTLTLMKKQISEIEREIALKKPECGRKHGEGDSALPAKLDLHLLDPLNKKVGEPPPPPAPHPHRSSNNNNSNIENGSPNSSTPPHLSSNSTSPSKVIGHLHSPQYTPVSVPVVGPQLLSSLGTLTSPGQVSPHMVPGHPATLEMHHKPGNSVSPSRESVEAAIADIKQAIRRTKNLPLKTHPQEKQDRGPVWIPRNNRRDLPYTKRHSSPPGPQTQENSPQIHQQDSSPSGGSNKSQERSLHEDEDGDTDQETDRLLGQQRSDEGYLDEKNWGRLRSKPSLPLSMAPNHKDVETEVSGINSNDSSPSTPSHQGSSSANIIPSSPQDILSSNKFLPKKDKDYGKKKGRSKEVMVHEPAVLIEGVLFRARYLGSTQLVSEGQPTKTTRMMQAEEAVSRIKAPEGEVQPSTEVDLFISTEKIMVLNTDLKEIMMDHALRTISYIADIGDLVVLMARRRVLPTDDQTDNPSQRIPKMICHVFESDEAQFIAQSIGQAFQVAYLEFLKANGIEDHSFVKEMDYQEVLNSQEIFGDELQMFAKKELQKEVVVPKMKGEILGVVVVESGWGSMVPTVVIANLSPTGAAAKCGQLNIGDQIIAINGISLVGLPLSNCQNYIKNTKYNTAVKLTVVPCPPVVEVKIRRPDTKYQLGFSVQNGVICSLLRGGIAERGGVRVGHRIIDINSQSVVAVPHEKIVNLLATSVGEIRMKTMPTSIFRLLTGQETPQYI